MKTFIIRLFAADGHIRQEWTITAPSPDEAGALAMERGYITEKDDYAIIEKNENGKALPLFG